MRPYVPHAGYVQRRIVRLLYHNRGIYSTKAIANALRISREQAYGALYALFNRRERFIRKYREGNERLWQLRHDKVHLAEEYLHIRKRRQREPYHKIEEEQEESTITIPIVKLAAKKILMYGLTSTIPLTREIYTGYLLAKEIYNSWDTIYTTLKTIEEGGIVGLVYDHLKGEMVEKLTVHQKEFVWRKVEDKIPQKYQNLAQRTIENVMENISEEEINLVEQTLSFI